MQIGVDELEHRVTNDPINAATSKPAAPLGREPRAAKPAALLDLARRVAAGPKRIVPRIDRDREGIEQGRDQARVGAGPDVSMQPHRRTIEAGRPADHHLLWPFAQELRQRRRHARIVTCRVRRRQHRL